MNGYSKKQTEELLKEIEKNTLKGDNIGKAFMSFAKKYNKASGSVRNYYYKLMAKESEAQKSHFPTAKKLKVNKIIKFTRAEEEKIVTDILITASNTSVRKAISKLCGDNTSLALRYQNKYRNLIKNDREFVERIYNGLKIKGIKCHYPFKEKSKIRNELVYKKLEEEMQSLIMRISKSVRDENAVLKDKLEKLSIENARLKEESLYKSTIKDYYNKDKVCND